MDGVENPRKLVEKMKAFRKLNFRCVRSFSSHPISEKKKSDPRRRACELSFFLVLNFYDFNA